VHPNEDFVRRCLRPGLLPHMQHFSAAWLSVHGCTELVEPKAAPKWNRFSILFKTQNINYPAIYCLSACTSRSKSIVRNTTLASKSA
jgi:hypothetical protein